MHEDQNEMDSKWDLCGKYHQVIRIPDLVRLQSKKDKYDTRSTLN